MEQQRRIRDEKMALEEAEEDFEHWKHERGHVKHHHRHHDHHHYEKELQHHHKHHKHHHRDYYDEDREHYHHGQMIDAVPVGEVEPQELIFKHGGGRHQDKKGAAKKLVKKLKEDPEAREKVKEIIEEHPEIA